jgi:hypothetical protein
MTLSETLDQLEADLHANKASERRAAVQRAAQMLRQRACLPLCRQRIVALLSDLAAKDLFSSVRDAAQAVLDNLAQGYDPAWLPADRQHMIGVTCPDGHVSYFDRRILCDQSRPFKRTMERAGERVEETVYMVCSADGCSHEVKILLDCKAYR